MRHALTTYSRYMENQKSRVPAISEKEKKVTKKIREASSLLKDFCVSVELRGDDFASSPRRRSAKKAA